MHKQDYYTLQQTCSARRRLTAIDLFSGAGGITLGLLNAGFRVLLASDINRQCAQTHRKNFPSVPFLEGDIRELSGSEMRRRAGITRSELDLLIGGPPCQGFSILGQRLLDDPRNLLLKEFIRVAEELRPRICVIENVPGLATLGKGQMLGEIGEAFAALGYSVDCAELLAAQYGVPQMRWRMFFIAWRDDVGLRHGVFPRPTHGTLGIGDLVPNRTITDQQTRGFLTIAEAIGDLPPIKSGELGVHYSNPPRSSYQRAMRVGTSALSNHYAPKLSSQNLERIRALKPGDDWRDLPRSLLPESMKRALTKDHTRRFRRMTWDGVARSIITRFRDPKSGEYIHPVQNRTISIREAARIQSFPDWFVFQGGYSDQYEQVGNAVPPLLAREMAVTVRQALMSTSEQTPIKSRYRIPMQKALNWPRIAETL